MWVALTLLAGLSGGLIFFKKKIPAGMLTGALLFVAALNFFTEKAFIWPQARTFAQILTGTYIGCNNDRKVFKHLPSLIKPYLVLMVSFLILNLIMGFFFFLLTDIDFLTCLLCAMPGGVMDTPLVAIDMGADSSMVAAMQMVRMLFGLSCIPYIICKCDQTYDVSSFPPDATMTSAYKKTTSPLFPFLPVLLLSSIAGLFGRISGIPAGTMSAALLATLVLRSVTETPPMPRWLRRLSQLITGCCIGSTVGMKQIMQLRQIIFPALLLCIAYMLHCIMMGRLLNRWFHTPLREAMLTFSPAGATEMALIAADIGVHSTDLVVLQICRLIGVMLLFPQIISAVALSSIFL